ncbi:ATP-binding protein [Nocardioides sp. R-C-SC26]|uniref:ATP-binding protein n=1 Tax=Nocardioides sp. R-C-SC26 TaxID=2870414 RepID=UPI001E3803D2|nr:ATP-binding protein [Nocardioides sp. R-C-SC26]
MDGDASAGPVARVVVLAGPSGSGKSRLAARLGLPVLRLDDYYKDGDDPTLPRLTTGPNAGLVDWDHPDSWFPRDAVAAIETLCHQGRVDVPVYEIAQNGRCGWQRLDLAGANLFVAEGIFAADVVAAARDAGVLAAAYCVRRSAWTTFWLRLMRDLRERRKPPLVLVRRGVALARAQRSVVADATAKGCTPLAPDEIVSRVEALAREQHDVGRVPR